MAVNLSPIFNEQQFDANGDPLVGGKLYTFAAGSSTPITTYTSITGLAAQSNPIVLNTRGEVDNPIWLTDSASVKFQLYDSNDVLVRTVDNVTGVNDVSSTVDQWIASGIAPTYVSATSFTVPGDQTSEFSVNRRLKSTVTAGTAYSYIASSVFTTLTTVTVVNDVGSALDSGLSAVSYGIITPTNTSLPQIPNFVKSDMIQDDAILTRVLADSTFNNASIVNGHVTVTPSVNTYIFALKTRAGTDPSATDPVIVTFRSSTLSSATIVTRAVTSALSFTISSGSTLGTTSAVANTLQVLLIDNAGTVEIAVVNNSGVLQLNEFGLISTTAEGGIGAADSADVIYSTTSRANVAYRNLEYAVNTQATAGTWVSAATQIQPYIRPPTVKGDGWVYLPEQASTSGTVIDFTGIPAWATEIEIFGVGVSTIGTSNLICLLGDAGGFEITAYTGQISRQGGSGADVAANSSSFILQNSMTAALGHEFKISLSYFNASNTWTIAATCCGSSGTLALACQTTGTKILSQPLTQVRLTTTIPDTYDGGAVRARFR
jgi:hypothetical protein